MADGGFFGGLSEGLTTARQQGMQQQQVDQQGNYQQGMLKLEQQRMQNEQQRALFARADKDVSNIMDAVTRTIEAGKFSGASNFQIAKTISKMVDHAKKLRLSSGGNEDSAAAIDAQVAASLAQPTTRDMLGGVGGESGQPPAQAGTAPPGSPQRGPSDIPAQPSGTGPRPPGQNLTDQNIVGVEPVSSSVTDSQGAIPSGRSPSDGEIARLQGIIAMPNAPEGVKQVAKMRLQEAMKRREELPQYFKTTDTLTGQDKIVGVDKRTGRQFDVVDNSMDAPAKAKLHDAFEQDLHGADFLKAVPAEMRNEVKAIASYKQNPNTSSIKGGQRERMLSWVHQYNPDWDQNVFTSKTKAYQVVGNRIGAIQTGMQGAIATAPRVLETSAAVNRTEYPVLNSIILAGRQGTGDKAVVNYGIAVNTFIMNYARAMGGGSSALTDSARGEAEALLQKAWSQGQIGSAIEQMQKEMKSELVGAKDAMSSLRDTYGDPDQAQQPDTAKKSAVPAPPAGFVITSP